MKTILSLIAGASMFALASGVGAQEPVKLTDGQMDKVTGGGYLAAAIANAGALGYANLEVNTLTATETVADPTGVICGVPCAIAGGTGQTISVSVWTPGLPVPGASANSASQASAALVPMF